MNVVRPSLVQLTFAPKELANRRDECRQAHNYLRGVWAACAAFGMTQPNSKLGLPTTLPDDFRPDGSRYTLKAARLDKSRPGLENEAVFFEYQDVLGTLVMLQSTAESEPADFWRETFSRWSAMQREHVARADGGGLPSGLLGEVYIFRGFFIGEGGLVSAADEEGVLDLSALPGVVPAAEAAGDAMDNMALRVAMSLPAEAGNWEQPFTRLTDKEFYLLDGGFKGARRGAAVLAPAARMASAYSWTVWGGLSQLAPFARYLLHSSKVYFAARLLEEELPGLRAGRAEVDGMLGEFFAHCTEAMGPGRRLTHGDLYRLRDEFVPLKLAKYDLIKNLSRLRELQVGVQTAKKNMAPLTPQAQVGTGGASFYDRDARAVDWLLNQLTVEIEYVGAVKERIEEGHQLLESRLGEEAQRASHRLNDLILYQGSLLGALIVGLTALQSLKLEVKLPAPVLWAAVFFFAALALALPPLVARWDEGYNRKDAAAAGALGAGVANLLAALAAAYRPLWEVGAVAWAAYQTLVIVAGFLLAAGVAWKRVRKGEAWRAEREADSTLPPSEDGSRALEDAGRAATKGLKSPGTPIPAAGRAHVPAAVTTRQEVIEQESQG